jgi:Glyoxalase-like domain
LTTVATSLDHVTWVTHDPQALQARFERLGFRLTPWSSRLGAPSQLGISALPWNVGNRCAMLRNGGYLEVLGATDPSRSMADLERYLDRYEGLHVVALGMDDADASLARLCQAGLPMTGLTRVERPVSDDDPDGPRIRVAHLTLPEAPEGRLQLVQHLTPDLLWQERFFGHRNRAVALDAAILAVERPANSAARFSRLAGRPVVPDPLGGFALPLARGVVRLLSPEMLPVALPGVQPPPAVPFIAAAVVRVDDEGRAVRALLGGEGREVPGGLLVSAGEDGAGGGWVLFTW